MVASPIDQYLSEVDSGGVGPLAGLMVLDISRILSGPYAAMLLGDMGARVIKVERPDTGDDTRSWGPPFVGEVNQQESAYFLSANRNKESIVLDFKVAADLEVFWALIDRADVVIENFRGGVLERLGIGHEAIMERNEKAVILSITGFGANGPDRDRPGYDQIIQGEAGIMSLTGPDAEHPTKVGVPIADLLAGIFGALGVTGALNERSRTGKGQIVRTSLLSAAIAVHAFQGTRWLVAGEIPQPEGNHHPTVSPYGTFRTKDGVIQIAVGNDSLWEEFAHLVGLSALDERFATNSDRVRNRVLLSRLIEEVFSNWTVAECKEKISALRIPVGEVRSLDQVYDDPQVLAEGLIIEAVHATLGAIRLPGTPISFQDFSKRHSAPPTLGQDSDAILKWLGMEKDSL